jgi:uncharacterized protein (DUF58 family)
VLTRQGWFVAGGALAMLVVGRLLGTVELYVFAVAAALVVVAAVVSVRLSRLRLEVSRELHPAKVHAGTDTRVELRAVNTGTRRTPLLRLCDPVAGTRGASLLVAPLRPGQGTRAAYRLPTNQRGVIHIGPLTAEVSDPFGLASVSTAAAGATELTVYPKVCDISPVRHAHGQDPHAGAEHPIALGRRGDDFYTLRAYVVGDDLRRVHWPSTARHDELMVRQDELPWQGRTTVLLDVRRGAHGPESFEDAVSAAASLVSVSWEERDLVRLVTTDGADSGFAAGHPHVESIMEYLATVKVSNSGGMRAALELLDRSGHGGSLVAVVGDAGPADLDAVRRLQVRYGAVTVVCVEPPAARHRAGAAGDGARAALGSTPVLRVNAERPFTAVWNDAMGRRRRTPWRAAPAAVAAPAAPAAPAPSPVPGGGTP